MIRRRSKKTQPTEDAQTSAPDPGPGPWDSHDVADDLEGYLDLGSLRIPVRPEFQVQVPQPEAGAPPAVLLVTEDAAVELRAFAAPRSGGLWEEVRQEMEAEVARHEGTLEHATGIHGPELRVSVPVKLPDGQAGVQPSRVVGIDGRRWLLRATFLGKAALEPDDDGVLEQALRKVVVVRGDGPRLLRETLPLTAPQDDDATEA